MGVSCCTYICTYRYRAVKGRHLTIHSSRTRFVASGLHLARRAGRLNSGVRPIMEDPRYVQLRKLRSSLVKAYVLHVVWFALMCAFVGWHWSNGGLKASVFLTLITVPPVLYYTVKMHTLCRSIDPSARTVGLVPVIVTTFVLSPFESGLILPLKNLFAANKLLKKYALASESACVNADGSNNSFKPNPLRSSKHLSGPSGGSA